MMKRIMAIMLMAVLVIALTAGCGGDAGEDMERDLGENLAEGLSGSDISSGEDWPDEMPADFPEMKNGDIVHSTAIAMMGKTNISITMENVSEKDFKDYLAEVEDIGFNVVISSQSGGIDSRTLARGENTASLQYAAKSEELIISYTGD